MEGGAFEHWKLSSYPKSYAWADVLSKRVLFFGGSDQALDIGLYPNHLHSLSKEAVRFLYYIKAGDMPSHWLSRAF
jgi:hypothetical protein